MYLKNTPTAKSFADRIDSAHGIHKRQIITSAHRECHSAEVDARFEYYHFEDGSTLIVEDDGRSPMEVDWK